ncbi:Rho GTPase activation protein [Stereum hirsutum FP-91666 SS1]|uniref:Rho GTPase activation protein n=1 Tax=Stereum hirsutum (strain FP-91666) TaxID=721885 RepID=UPI000440BC8D|nr:Rho GTPase activation protein [Stereum hirsutum FP-91666 SS1]EIM91464.1 Rho GTPase activation protein [Stereum hirsutum FP-91666 SS1]
MTAEQHPPTRASLRAWWQNFTSAQKSKAGGQPGSRYDLDKSGLEEHPVFGKPLKESLKYASVQISTANSNGELYVWGYIPVVVAKCGLFLKENATEVEGTFRVNGSNKRMRDLQALFESPPRYGKSLDWKKEQYTAHDVASVFRRYLTQMPEPVIPYNLYFDFRNAIAKKPYNQDEVIATYKRLIHSMPRANQYLLLYVLDLLSVFARKADKNLMTAQNLAVIFRPGIMSHPEHELTPKEHQLSQEVVEFLIAHQDWFMLDIPPPPENYSNSPYHPNSANPGAGGNPQGNAHSSPYHAHNNSPYGAREDMEDVVLVSSSEDEGSPATTGTGGWKLVGGRGAGETGQGQGQKRVARRRTMNERDKGVRGAVVEGRRSSKDLSPVAEAPSRGEGSPIGVTRSRTLPSTRSGRSGHTERGVPPSAGAAATTAAAGAATTAGTTAAAAATAAAGAGITEGRGAVTDDEHERHGRVLKKPRPSSAQPPPSSSRGKGAKSPVGTKDVGAPVQGSLVGSANVGKDSTAGGAAAGGGAAPPQPIEGVPTPVQGS